MALIESFESSANVVLSIVIPPVIDDVKIVDFSATEVQIQVKASD